MYEPREDSYLVLKHVKNYAKGSVLDVGTGSGILAVEASRYSNSVIGTDIDKKLINKLNKEYNKKIKNLIFIYSDLFSSFKNRYINYNKKNKKFIINKINNKNNKFNLIILNPPYLPEDKNIKDKTIYGGKKGYEAIEKFLNNVKNYLKKDGKILLLFSSLTNKKKINESIKNNNLKYKPIDKERIFFEELYVYLIYNYLK